MAPIDASADPREELRVEPCERDPEAWEGAAPTSSQTGSPLRWKQRPPQWAVPPGIPALGSLVGGPEEAPSSGPVLPTAGSPVPQARPWLSSPTGPPRSLQPVRRKRGRIEGNTHPSCPLLHLPQPGHPDRPGHAPAVHARFLREAILQVSDAQARGTEIMAILQFQGAMQSAQECNMAASILG
ncbi:Hypothetical predicted protein [Scomber scombrus]|uniref:Uncharacterized protein n=1 Tax=Scomber scombrus TaxID=13677 RepID=A0AAV1P708_SCOSC